MDRTTTIHLEAWLHSQFPHVATESDYMQTLKSAIIAQFETDPKHYQRVGWWRCHDDAGLDC